MIDLSSAPQSADVTDTTDQSFVADVIEGSREIPVIVDFWAPWCGPCKTLGPMLEDAVRATKGKVRMVKVNVDENQMVAGQLRVQSIPAVYAFFQGQPVDGFMGAVPASEIKQFVQRLVDMAGGGGLEDALDAADGMLEAGQIEDAAQTYAAIAAEEPETPRAHAGMARAALARGDLEGARLILAKVPAKIAEDGAVAAARAAVELAEQTAGAGEADELKARLAGNPDDHEARYDLALALVAANDHAGAVDELLELFRRDREWNDGAAKTQLMKLFDTLGPKDPLAKSGRRRLSSMIFA
ncbi:thioredoxin [Paralimibaculum aggregatum]|uniref:Thioredoxin n=1 Tax=Paralimibaculum aggregatum TaxID=3036245 RepID=A0ABQ6LMI0_9RHOB|nr:thioredoxin [Limibaculum sp. NKW23]GMG82897.1 thioredoxin [Limibaculum sp. NKW23]